MLISHNLAVVSEMADDIAVMYLGKRVEFGSTDTIFDNPLHPYTQGLWRSITQRGRSPRKACTDSGRCSQSKGLATGVVFSLLAAQSSCPACAMHQNQSRSLRQSPIILSHAIFMITSKFNPSYYLSQIHQLLVKTEHSTFRSRGAICL